jgi:hypothetical protein
MPSSGSYEVDGRGRAEQDCCVCSMTGKMKKQLHPNTDGMWSKEIDVFYFD